MTTKRGHNSSIDLCLLLLFVCLTQISASPQTDESLWELVIHPLLSVSHVGPTSSPLSCVRLCRSVCPPCFYFTYTTTSHSCHCGTSLATNVTSPADDSDVTYALSLQTMCQAEPGFHLYTVDDQEICIKIMYELQNFTNARSKCSGKSNQGLFMADSKEKFRLLERLKLVLSLIDNFHNQRLICYKNCVGRDDLTL